MVQFQSVGDKFAIFLSSLCVVHCILTPLLLVALPSLSGLALLEDETFHELILLFVVPIGLMALLAGFRHHKSKSVFVIGVLGLVVLAVAASLPHDIVSETGETLLTVAASVLIVFAHIRNFSLRHRQCEH